MTKGARIATRILLCIAVTLVVALQFLDPGVGPLEKPMSSYALGTYASLWLLAVVSGGGAMLIEARARTTRATWAGHVLSVTGLAFIVLGLFITDPWYPWEHPLTPRGWVHVIATGVGMGGLAVSMLFEVVSTWGKVLPLAASAVRIVAALYVLIVSAVGLSTLTLVILGRNVPLIGLEERVLIALAFLWIGLKSFDEG